jgi:oxalate decarboxylase/phosphoglucose isomerase-like protein (cupin superfamily)
MVREIPDVMTAASNAYRVLLENEHVRVMEVVLTSGQKAPMHNHPNDHVVYVVNDAKMRLDFPDGTFGEFDLTAGQALFLNAGPHETTNTGPTVARNVVVELRH